MDEPVSVVADLKLWGPDASERKSISLEQAQSYCRRLARSHYENFPVVTWLLPKPLHQHFYNVYAFCRWADDLGDEMGDPARSLQLLAWWREELQRCYASIGGQIADCRGQRAEGRKKPEQESRKAKDLIEGPIPNPKSQIQNLPPSALCPLQSAIRPLPQHPVFIALGPTIERFAIPITPFDDLIRAFEQDQRVREYETFAQLVDYCTRSANPVGRLVLYLCEQFNEENARYADSICTGLQLANFWQDVARDYDIGRIYLPKEDRERFGYGDDEYSRRITNDAFLNLMQFEVAWARQFLRTGFPLVERVPGRIQVDVELFIRGGLAIANAIERIDFQVWERRPMVSKWDVLCAATMALSGYVGRRLRRRG